MKSLSELSTKEAIELFAATFFRVWGFVYLLDAFSAVWHLKSYYEYAASKPPFNAYDRHTFTNYSFDIAFYAILAVLMLCVSVGLARLVTRGLHLLLEKNPNISS